VGKPADEILAYTKEHAISLIVMGKDGHRKPRCCRHDRLGGASRGAGSEVTLCFSKTYRAIAKFFCSTSSEMAS
jgi:hypothetical protein